MNDNIIIFTTFPDCYDIKPLTYQLLNNKKAACIQKLRPIESYYMWEGEIQKDSEILILIKTSKQHFDDICKIISSDHPYDTPQIISVKSDDMSQSYHKWIRDNTNK